MDLCNDFKAVVINTTAGGEATLFSKSTAHTERRGCLNALAVQATSAGTVRIASVAGTSIAVSSTAATALTGPMPVAGNGGLAWPFNPLAQGTLRGTAGHYLRIGSTGTSLKGYAITSWTTTT